MTDHPNLKPEGRALIELKPCPFCGHAPVVISQMQEDLGELDVQVRCHNCAVAIVSEYRQDAVDLWNRREDGRCSTGEGRDDYSETIPCPICGGNDDNQQLMCEACGGAGLLGSIEPPVSSPPPSGEVRGKLLDTDDLTERAPIDHPDAYLNALLSYTRDLYGALAKAGWKPTDIVDCFQHIERAARGLHAKALPGRDEAALPEAVAWRCFDLILGDESVITDRRHAEARAARTEDWRVEPLYAAPQPSTKPPADVVRLVIAARNVAFEDHPSPEALRELDQASEAFADRVPWENQEGGPCASIDGQPAFTSPSAVSASVSSPMAETGSSPSGGSTLSEGEG